MVKDDAGDRLIAGGLKDYYEAMVVLRRFRQEVLGQCRTIVEKRLPDLSRAIGRKLDPDMLVDSPMPDSPYPDVKKFEGWWNEHWAWLAVRLDIEGLGCLLAGLLWQPEVGVVAGFEIRRRELFDALLKRFKQAEGSRVENPWGHHIELWDVVPHSDLHVFPQKLNEALGDWIRLWTEIGGLKSVRK